MKKKQRETEKIKKTAKKTEKDKNRSKTYPDRFLKRKQPSEPGPTTFKRAKITSQRPADENVDSNVCCACFSNYEDNILAGSGAVRNSCTCGRWLHENCVEECKEDDQGNDRMCPLCVDVLIR